MSRDFRFASSADAEEIREIYLPWVEESAVAFEWSPPSVEEIRSRIESKDVFPWIVYEPRDTVLGYTTARSHRPDSAYQWTVESAVYVRSETHRQRIGRGLYTALFELLRRQGYRSVLAIVTVPNEPSTAFHRAMGFELVGTLQAVGFKDGKWHDQKLFQRHLADRDFEPRPTTPVPIREVGESEINRAFEVARRTVEPRDSSRD